MKQKQPRTRPNQKLKHKKRKVLGEGRAWKPFPKKLEFSLSTMAWGNKAMRVDHDRHR